MLWYHILVLSFLKNPVAFLLISLQGSSYIPPGQSQANFEFHQGDFWGSGMFGHKIPARALPSPNDLLLTIIRSRVTRSPPRTKKTHPVNFFPIPTN